MTPRLTSAVRSPASSWSLAVMFLTHDWQLIPEMWMEQIWGTVTRELGFVNSVIISVIIISVISVIISIILSVILSVIISVIVSVTVSVIISVIISVSIINVFPIIILDSCMRRYLRDEAGGKLGGHFVHSLGCPATV